MLQSIKAGRTTVSAGFQQIADLQQAKAASAQVRDNAVQKVHGVSPSTKNWNGDVSGEVILLGGSASAVESMPTASHSETMAEQESSRDNTIGVPAGPPNQKSKSTGQPVVLTQMEQRAARRAELKAARLHRQKEKERDKRAAELAAEQVALERVELARRERASERRAKEKQAESKKRGLERRKEATRKKVELADAFRKATLLRFYGWRPWRVLVASIRTKAEQADGQLRRVTAQKCWRRWRGLLEARRQRAAQVHTANHIHK